MKFPVGQLVLAASVMFPSIAHTQYLGEVRAWAIPKFSSPCPKNWLPADGRELEERKYLGLAQRIGGAFDTPKPREDYFRLPDLQARLVVNRSDAWVPGMSDHFPKRGSEAGSDIASVTPHQHNVMASDQPADIGDAEGAMFVSHSHTSTKVYKPQSQTDLTGDVAFHENSVSETGEESPDNWQPTLVLQYCVCVVPGPCFFDPQP